MKANLFHYTGIIEFRKILRDESLRCWDYRLAKGVSEKDGIPFEEVLKKLTRKLTPDSEKERLGNVYFGRDLEKVAWEGRSEDAYKQGELVILGFGVPEEKLGDKISVIMPELSLDCLVEIHAQDGVFDTVVGLIRGTHNGKYKNIPVYLRD